MEQFQQQDNIIMKKNQTKPNWVEENGMAKDSIKTDLKKINDIKYLLKGKSNVIFKADIEKILNS